MVVSASAYLLDLLNRDVAAVIRGVSDDDRPYLARQLDSYRYALAELIDERQDPSRKRASQRRASALQTLQQLSSEIVRPTAAEQNLVRKKIARMELTISTSYASYKPLASVLVSAVPRKRQKILMAFRATKATAAESAQRLAKSAWSGMELAATACAEIRSQVLQIETPPLSQVGRGISDGLATKWLDLPFHRIRQCAWRGCDVPGGRFFVVNTSERDCPTCRRTLSRDARSRVRRGVTKKPRQYRTASSNG